MALKIEHRIPTTQFGYISVYIEPGEELTPEVIKGLIADHRGLLMAYSEPQAIGLSEKEYNAFIDRQLNGEPNHIEDYEQMSDEQKRCVQVIKRSLKRLKAKEE